MVKFDIKILKPLIAFGGRGIEDTDQATGYMGDHFIHSRNTPIFNSKIV